LQELSEAINNNELFGPETLANLALKATNSLVVHNTGSETIAGGKTFTSNLRVENFLNVFPQSESERY
jgi:hypothetical protein